MKLMIRYFSFFIIIALYFGSFAQAQKKSEREDLPNFAEVNATLYRGGQPTQAGIEQLKAKKIRTIVYLRGADEKAKTEERWTAPEIKFKSFPLNNWLRPKDSQIKDILTFINDPQNQPVFVHCRRGADRTGTVIAVYRISHDGKTAKEAVAEAKEFHMGWWQFWMKDYINDYYRDFKK